jgi:hypothetical protein
MTDFGPMHPRKEPLDAVPVAVKLAVIEPGRLSNDTLIKLLGLAA